MKRQWIKDWIKIKEEKYRTVSRRLWQLAETGMEEVGSSALLCKVLEEEGFKVTRNLAGIPTAFQGSFGQGKPVIGILGEFDALEGLSQAAGKAKQKSCKEMKNGHGCGHNLLGAGSLAAAAAVKHYLETQKLPGTIRYYGCPGEEKGCGKVHMSAAGCFDDLDAALTWHPMDYNAIEGRGSLADLCMKFYFTGTSAHAASCPHKGRSALDAAELLNIAANFMREHIIPEARIHYAFTEAGGTAPNIIPDKVSILYEVRAPKRSQAEELQQRLIRAAKGAALMTDTKVKTVFMDGYSDYIPNDCLNRIAYKKLCEVGYPVFSDRERDFASEIRKTYETVTGGAALNEELQPYEGLGGCLSASTDVGDVSYKVPTVQLYISCCASGTPGHSWQMVSQTGSSLGEAGMLTAAEVLALTAIELMEKPDILRQAWREHQALFPPAQ